MFPRDVLEYVARGERGGGVVVCEASTRQPMRGDLEMW